MGHELERLAHDHGLVVVERYDIHKPLGVAPVIDFDVAVDFTHPSVVLDNVATLLRWGKPVVVGTTGWLEHLPPLTNHVTEAGGRVVYGSNFSVGVLTFTRIVREAARLFNELAQYDASVHETHHTGKADAPSGTALSLARTMLEQIERKHGLLTETAHETIDPDLLHVTSQRLGKVVGTHVVAFDSESDTIELIHRAKDRSGFAHGALLAARWIVNQPSGIYRFEDVI